VESEQPSPDRLAPSEMVTPLDLDTQQEISELLAMPFPNPFNRALPKAAAQRAARSLQRELTANAANHSFPTNTLAEIESGKMFGALIVQNAEGDIGFLKGFSGMLAGSWDLPGFVPPLFDRAERTAVEIPGELSVKDLTARARHAAGDPELAAGRETIRALKSTQTTEAATLRAHHQESRRGRKRARALLPSDEATCERGPQLEELARQSSRDKHERLDLRDRQQAELTNALALLKPLEQKVAALDRLRRFVCRRLMQQIHDTYRVPSSRGETRYLRELFSPAEPPSGAGDCAGPKLLAYAYRHNLRPLALTEFWWGAPPPTGGRHRGVAYPACRGKCEPMLPFMLEGLNREPVVGFLPPDSQHLDLQVIYEDKRIVVINKPPGLLSVPSSNTAITDSAAARLVTRYPQQFAPLLVHRLDMDTSGLLIAALDPDAHAILQRQFVKRTIKKRYIAWVDGELQKDEGRIDLALRVDIDDRPRHVVDPANGKRAVTEWKVLERQEGRTCVALFPITGRTHQLRVHAAHPQGLNAPIIGDHLYGRGGPRLFLHAECLTLTNPSTNTSQTFTSHEGRQAASFETFFPF
jgi:tRNA pseudouridine32 synthase/23S rRNA pseudouridine746 synthase